MSVQSTLIVQQIFLSLTLFSLINISYSYSMTIVSISDFIHNLVGVIKFHPHHLGFIKFHRRCQVKSILLIFSHKNFGSIFKVFNSSQNQRRIQLVAALISYLMDSFVFFHAFWRYPKSIHPIVATVN